MYHFNEKKLSAIMNDYKNDFDDRWKNEGYKWEAVQKFQKEWRTGDNDFPKMLYCALSSTKNLLANAHWLPRDAIEKYAAANPEPAREMFRALFDEDMELSSRILQFQERAEANNIDYQDERAVSTYLWLRFPARYYIYMYRTVKKLSEAIEYNSVPKHGNGIANIDWAMKFYDEIKMFLEDDRELDRLLQNHMASAYCAGASKNTLVYDLAWYVKETYMNGREVLPYEVKGAENRLFYGVPGSGKSYKIKKEYCDDFSRMERIVFHPDYSHSDFIGQILPAIDEASQKLKYAFCPGPFTKILKKAVNDPGNKYFLIIEELNRGNAPAIFGEIFQLLDRNESGGSDYAITNHDVARTVYNDENHPVTLPPNLWILATMNTSDQNVFTLDTAFQRRWIMHQVENDVKSASHGDKCIEGSGVTWGNFVTTANECIVSNSETFISLEDKRLGAYFVIERELKKDRFPEKVIKYLWDDAFKMDRDAFFKSGLKTLEEVIRTFKNACGEADSLGAILRQDVFGRMTGPCAGNEAGDAQPAISEHAK